MGSLLNIGYGSGQRGLSSPIEKIQQLWRIPSIGAPPVTSAGCMRNTAHSSTSLFMSVRKQSSNVRFFDFTCQSWELVFSCNGSTRTGSQGNMAWSIAWTAAKAP